MIKLISRPLKVGKIFEMIESRVQDKATVVSVETK
jgi:hypothetical protein